jgi:hypothetical protein
MVGLINAYNFSSLRKVLVGSSCKPFKYDFSVYYEVFASLSVKIKITFFLVKILDGRKPKQSELWYKTHVVTHFWVPTNKKKIYNNNNNNNNNNKKKKKKI